MRITTYFVAAVAAVALSATPAAAQHRGHGGGGHGGGHSSGGHRGGGHAIGSATHRDGHASQDRHTSSGPVDSHRAVPRGSAAGRHVDQHTTVVVPSHRGHRSGFGGFGLGTGAYGSLYGYGYSPYAYGYSPYYGGYSSGYYGGYSSGYYGRYVRGGHARLRIIGTPRHAEVFVDGYYAGIVDDFDGVFQHLELEPGSHQIEIRAPGFEAIGFDVRAEGGRTITYRARMVPYRP